MFNEFIEKEANATRAYATIFRIEKNRNNTVISNHHLRNKELSLKSKGLLSLMLSLPEEWDYTLKGLSIICKEGIDAIRVSIVELEKQGYIERRRNRNTKGQLTNTEYIIHEYPKPLHQSRKSLHSLSAVLEMRILLHCRRSIEKV